MWPILMRLRRLSSFKAAVQLRTNRMYGIYDSTKMFQFHDGTIKGLKITYKYSLIINHLQKKSCSLCTNKTVDR